MATRSTIAYEDQNGVICQIYCHYDGYLEGVGYTLQHYYTDPAKLDQLMQLGDISVLGKEIGVQRPFSNPFKYDTPEYHAHDAKYEGMCLAYGRDRGEPDTTARVYGDYNTYWANSQQEEYNYIFRNGQWFVSEWRDRRFVPLMEAFELERS